MTDTKNEAVDKSVDSTKPTANLPSVSPASSTVNNKPGEATMKQPAKWAFDPKTVEAKGTYVAAPQHDVPAEVDPLLVTMLCWPRSHNSPEELAFTAWLKNHITTELKRIVEPHSEGAFSVTIPSDKVRVVDSVSTFIPSTTLFSCHVDTVDQKMMDSATRKKLTYDPGFGTIALDSTSAGNCLGADDSAGIWLMLKMIEAGTPGTYLFHRGEEVGGISARAIASKETLWLGQFQAAVAFDRKDNGDIVTVQGGLRCASPKFASRLGGMLDAFGFQYKESTTGSYTDVKDYRGLIAEVVNLSCGYDSAHSRNETLDYAHLHALAEALPKVEWESLPVDRDPKAKDPETQTWKGSRNFGGLFDDEDKQWGKANGTKKRKKTTLAAVGTLPPTDPFEDQGFEGMSWSDIEDVVNDDVSWTVEQIVKLLRRNAQQKADITTLQNLMGM